MRVYHQTFSTAASLGGSGNVFRPKAHTGVRSMPRWVFDLLRQRIDALGIANLPLIIEPQTAGSTHRVLSLGRIEARPTVKLTPRLRAEGLDWRQDLTRLLAKAVAYVTAPDGRDTDFWRRWKEAADGDRLREKARGCRRRVPGRNGPRSLDRSVRRLRLHSGASPLAMSYREFAPSSIGGAGTPVKTPLPSVNRAPTIWRRHFGECLQRY